MNVAIKSTMIFLVLNFILKLILNGLLQYMILFLSALQMVVHL